MHHPTNCLNCNQPFVKEANFCANCGQKTPVHRLSLAHLGHDVVHYFTHADKSIFNLVKMLAIRPGSVAREYVQGRRKHYFSPLNFFLIVVGLFVFVMATFKPMGGSTDMVANKAEVMKIEDPVVRERRMAKLERAEKATGFVTKYANIIRMVATPVFALIFFLFYFKSGYNFTEFLVAALYFSGFTALIMIFIITPYLLAVKGTANFAGIAAYFLIEIIYWSLAMYYFVNKRSKGRMAYAFFVSFVVTTTWFICTGSLVRWYIDKGF